jgi:hypothetical protein
MDFIPEKSEIQIEEIEISKDHVLKSMIKDLGVKHLVPQMNRPAANKPRRAQQ